MQVTVTPLECFQVRMQFCRDVVPQPGCRFLEELFWVHCYVLPDEHAWSEARSRALIYSGPARHQSRKKKPGLLVVRTTRGVLVVPFWGLLRELAPPLSAVPRGLS